MKPKISVIVPVYNVEQYIKKCLDSLINQSISSIEIIIVNDGSTDGSDRIIRTYISKFKNIIYVTQDNKGLSDARNNGVKYASGEYIAFLDSDDWVSDDAYEKLYKKAIINDDEIVCCGFYMAYNDGDKLRRYSPNQEYTSVTPHTNHGMFKDIKVAAWDKIYKRDFFEHCKIYYPSGLWYEDTAVSVPLLLKASKVSVIKDALVFYRQRDGSITKQTAFNSKIFDVYKVYEDVVRHTSDLDDDVSNIYQYFFIKKCLIDNFIRLHNYHKLPEFISLLRKEYYVRYNFFDILKNDLLSFKEKIIACLILLSPCRFLLFIANKGLK